MWKGRQLTLSPVYKNRQLWGELAIHIGQIFISGSHHVTLEIWRSDTAILLS